MSNRLKWSAVATVVVIALVVAEAVREADAVYKARKAREKE